MANTREQSNLPVQGKQEENVYLELDASQSLLHASSTLLAIHVVCLHVMEQEAALRGIKV